MVATINADTTNGVIITSDTSGEIELQANGVTKAKVTANGLQDANGNSLRGGMYRNLIINGDMRIDQRGGTVTVNNASDNYGIDRWQGRGTASDGVFTTVQDTESPTGFTNSAKITVTTADASIGTTERYEYRHRVEGNNISNLAWGSANAKTVTLSFWVRSSVTGTFGGSLTNSAGNRSYVFSYTISSANTWEQKTITIEGDTSGTWLTTNGIGITVTFSLGHGSDYVQNAGSWYASYEAAVTGQTNLIATNSATWYLTGVQLEVGSGASDFEHLPYDVQLARCQRYCQVYSGALNGNAQFALGYTYNATLGLALYQNFKAQMRALPSLTASGSFIFNEQKSTGYNGISASGVAINQASNENCHLQCTISGGTSGTPATLAFSSSTSGKLIFSAEL